MKKFKIKQYNSFIGIDPSLTGTGVCILDENCQLLSSVLIKTNSKDIIEFRYDTILSEIQKTIDQYADKCIIYIEGIGFGCRGNSIYQLGGLHYLIRYCLWKKKIKFEVIPPTKLKKFITGKGNVKKEQMLKEVYKKWSMDFDDNNICDAYCLARIGLESVVSKK